MSNKEQDKTPNSPNIRPLGSTDSAGLTEPESGFWEEDLPLEEMEADDQPVYRQNPTIPASSNPRKGISSPGQMANRSAMKNMPPEHKQSESNTKGSSDGTMNSADLNALSVHKLGQSSWIKPSPYDPNKAWLYNGAERNPYGALYKCADCLEWISKYDKTLSFTGLGIAVCGRCKIARFNLPDEKLFPDPSLTGPQKKTEMNEYRDKVQETSKTRLSARPWSGLSASGIGN